MATRFVCYGEEFVNEVVWTGSCWWCKSNGCQYARWQDAVRFVCERMIQMDDDLEDWEREIENALKSFDDDYTPSDNSEAAQ